MCPAFPSHWSWFENPDSPELLLRSWNCCPYIPSHSWKISSIPFPANCPQSSSAFHKYNCFIFHLVHSYNKYYRKRLLIIKLENQEFHYSYSKILSFSRPLPNSSYFLGSGFQNLEMSKIPTFPCPCQDLNLGLGEWMSGIMPGNHFFLTTHPRLFCWRWFLDKNFWNASLVRRHGNKLLINWSCHQTHNYSQSNHNNLIFLSDRLLKKIL